MTKKAEEKKPLKKGQNGGPRVGAGRPKGSRNIYSHESVKKLEEMGFNPIEQMIIKYHEIDEMVSSGIVRAGTGAHAQLMATQQKIANDLMQYSYKKVPEKIEQEISTKKPIAVKLNLKKKTTTKDEDNKDS